MAVLVRRAINVLREDGILAFLWASFRFVFWRNRMIKSIPLPLLYYFFEIRSRIHPCLSDANPLRLVWVHPDEIRYYHPRGPGRLGAVVSGSWDDLAIRFEDHPVFKSFRKRYEENVDWAETELYKKYHRKLESGEPYWRCTSSEELHGYFERLDELYEDISKNGYKSQRVLLSEVPERTKEMNSDCIHAVFNEIGVNICRNGTFVKIGSGNHRLSIAKIVGIDEVPVIVRARHEKWQELRDEIGQASSPDQLSSRARRYLDHPDLEDIVPASWSAPTKLN